MQPTLVPERAPGSARARCEMHLYINRIAHLSLALWVTRGRESFFRPTQGHNISLSLTQSVVWWAVSVSGWPAGWQRPQGNAAALFLPLFTVDEFSLSRQPVHESQKFTAKSVWPTHTDANCRPAAKRKTGAFSYHAQW